MQGPGLSDGDYAKVSRHVSQSWRFELYDAPPHQVRLQGGDASSDSYCYHEIGGTEFSKLRAGLEANLAASSSSTMANGCRVTVSALAYNRQDAFITPLASAV
jgi:hypothetical protein